MRRHERKENRRAAAAAAVGALLALLPVVAGCGGSNTGSFIDQNGFQIGIPRGAAPTEEARARVAQIVAAVVPPAGVTTPPAETQYTFEGGYTARLVWKSSVAGSSGQIEGPAPGLPATFQVSQAGTIVQYTDLSIAHFDR